MYPRSHHSNPAIHLPYPYARAALTSVDTLIQNIDFAIGVPLTLLAILLLLIGGTTGMKYIRHAALMQASTLTIAADSQKIIATGYAIGMNYSEFTAFTNSMAKQGNFSTLFFGTNSMGICPGKICRIITVSGKSYVMVLK